MLLFRELLKPLIYKAFWHIFTKYSILLNVYRRIEILIQKISRKRNTLQLLILLGLQALCPFFLLCIVIRENNEISFSSVMNREYIISRKAVI